MPKLGKITTKRLQLPSSQYAPNEEDRAYVVAVDRLLMGAIVDMAKIDNDTERIVMCLTEFITDWNYTDDDNQKLPISPENIRLLEAVDFNFLATEFASVMESAESGLSKEEKKASTVTSEVTDKPKEIAVFHPISVATDL
jgi:hypothetical protein